MCGTMQHVGYGTIQTVWGFATVHLTACWVADHLVLGPAPLSWPKSFSLNWKVAPFICWYAGLWNFGRRWTNQSWIVASYYKLVPQPIVTKCTTISAEEAYVSSCTQLLYIPDAEHLTYMHSEWTTELGKWIRIWYKRNFKKTTP